MLLTVTHANDHTIALPEWLLQALGLQEGALIDAVALHRFLYFRSPTLPPLQDSHDDAPVIEDLPSSTLFTAEDSLDALITKIKSQPPNLNAIHPAAKPATQWLRELETTPITEGLFSFEEWQPLWQTFDEEEKALDRAREIAKGLL